jgi:colanic acid biosynthesis glycosyl transferase WcaI
MKILVVSQYFWPENFRINDLCTGLVEKGHSVTVLTGVPNYPGGAVFKEYQDNPRGFDSLAGVEIVRSPIITRGSNSRVLLALNYLSYFVSASTWGMVKLRKHDFDIVFVCQLSPVTIAIPAIAYKYLFKKPIVMWVLDLWPESLQATGLTNSRLILGAIDKLVRFIYWKCDIVLGQSKVMVHEIQSKVKLKEKVSYFPSWAEDVFISGQSAAKVSEIQDFDGFKLLFAGNVGESQDFPKVLDAMDYVRRINPNVALFIVGDGRAMPYVKSRIREAGLEDNVKLLGRFPIEQMPGFYNSADALLVSLRDEHIFSMTIPGKVQSYLAAGKPLLGMLNGEGASVINESGAGFAAPASDYQALAEHILFLANLPVDKREEMGRKSIEYGRKNYDRNSLIDRLVELFGLVLKSA